MIAWQVTSFRITPSPRISLRRQLSDHDRVLCPRPLSTMKVCTTKTQRATWYQAQEPHMPMDPVVATSLIMSQWVETCRNHLTSTTDFIHSQINNNILDISIVDGVPECFTSTSGWAIPNMMSNGFFVLMYYLSDIIYFCWQVLLHFPV